MLWDDALLDAQMVIKLTPSSYVGYKLGHVALHGAQRYDEAIDAFQTMLSKFENAPDTQTRKLRQQYVSPSEAEGVIQETIEAQLDDAPHRLLNTFTGRLCDREGQIDAFKTSTEYKELLSSTLEIVAESGDITALDWVGTSSEFNSCLPADITSYEAPPYTLPSISEDEMQRSILSLQDTMVVELALELYSSLDRLSAARFAHRRLHLPCIAFPVTEVRRRPTEHEETYFTYEVKADGLRDLQITTEDRLLQFSRGRPARQSFLLVRPWDRRLIELPDYADDTESVDDFALPGSFGGEGPVDSESSERAMRLIVRLGQPFSAFLLAQQRSGEYKRIASDHDIITQVKEVDSVHGIRTLEIL
ncbi:hypothetical protein BDR05DRAFT_988141 [Suillus weaverae]|nr:hypothetical protein BDR05DRAFT_988141 [Suillus weaverae]